MANDNSQIIRKRLLNWYGKNKRTLSWRYEAGETPNPYYVWVSEVMLQQTVVAAVIPYFEKFIARYPTLSDLACADEAAVMATWAGLGYYSRARNMIKCARIIVADYDGVFPDTEAELLKLAGIGAYTAAAIAAIAFGRATSPVDGNIERVISRLYALTTPLPPLKAEVKEIARTLYPKKRAGDFAQAMMDLGASICAPKNPDCQQCPCCNYCLAYEKGIAAQLPHRTPKPPKPTRGGIVYWLENRRGQVLVMQRPDKGLLGGMVCFPSSGWDSENDAALADIIKTRPMVGEVRHTFTHFHLTLKVCRASVPKGFRAPNNYFWISPEDFDNYALPSLMRKVAKFASAD
ncbi:MAG: A/G-specific adenine glycosylase [Alphaproteobacteria bacterium]|nr:A/G-specific adenine glycosylase [Alphaproteobacteria bacterium]